MFGCYNIWIKTNTGKVFKGYLKKVPGKRILVQPWFHSSEWNEAYNNGTIDSNYYVQWFWR
jgi:hypothetical protein